LITLLYRKIQLLDRFPGPRCLAQKLETGFYRWVILKAADIDTLTQVIPAELFDQAAHNVLQGFSMQRVIGLLMFHALKKYEYLAPRDGIINLITDSDDDFGAEFR